VLGSVLRQQVDTAEYQVARRPTHHRFIVLLVESIISTMSAETDTNALLRHLLATLAYRAAKVLRDAPPGFGDHAFGPTARHPVQIVAHMGDLMAWAVTIADGDIKWNAGGSDDWNRGVARFFDGLTALDRALAADGPFKGSVDKLIQGPLADALTHVGQLALLRGMAGAPVRPESYARAKIETGRVGRDQPAPGFEFDGDASARK
jgi:hypothetical protein